MILVEKPGRKRSLESPRCKLENNVTYWGSVTNNNRLWIRWSDLWTFLQIQSIIIADNRWLSKTRSIPYWTTSVFSSIVTNDESLLTHWTPWTTSVWRMLPSQREICVTTDGQLASLSWSKAPFCCLRSDIYYCHIVADLLMWDALSDERTGLSFARVTAVISLLSMCTIYILHTLNVYIYTIFTGSQSIKALVAPATTTV
jgi:hypothetical protein